MTTHTATKPVQVQIRLDVSRKTIAYLRLQEQWENEGGATTMADPWDSVPEQTLPFHPGDLLKVVDGHLELMDDEIFYNITVERVQEEA